MSPTTKDGRGSSNHAHHTADEYDCHENTTERSDLGDERARGLTKALSNAPDNTNHDEMGSYIAELAQSQALSVLFIMPGTKVPADPRTVRRRNADDEVAREAARDAGRAKWRKVKSPKGVTLATHGTDTLKAYLDEYLRLYPGQGVNLAVSAGRSRLVVVDCDTRAQVAAFLRDMGAEPDTQPTVCTPGALNSAGEWVHRDGGHFYFVVPDDVELPAHRHSMTVGEGNQAYSVKWGENTYVLIPPSTRAEGAYELVGDVAVLPDELRECINDYSTAHPRAKRPQDASEHASSITEWGAATSWAQILADANGWIPTGQVDSCGCDTWTAPGPHDSPKSATAHEPGCGEWTDSPDPPLHIWTDHDVEPFTDCAKPSSQGRTVTRLRAVAALDYAGSDRAAMEALDLFPDLSLSADDGRVEPSTDTARTPSTVFLPPDFFDSRTSLRHIRDAAFAYRAAPDAVLAAVMARVSAHVPPSVRVDTGIMSPLPLHLFVDLTSVTGAGKTGASNAAEALVAIKPGWSSDPYSAPDGLMVPASGESWVREVRPKTGEGIAEAFWGVVGYTDDNGKTRTRRARVRSNALMTTDEGAGLVNLITDPKSSVGETIRSAWSGAGIGQSNANNDLYRPVTAGTYTVALITGMQLSVVGEFLTPTELAKGTPQRFLYSWCKPDPAVVTAEMVRAVADPGVLDVVIPVTGFRLCESLRRKVDDERLANWISDDEVSTPQISSQSLAMISRVAALLAIIDGRSDVDDAGKLVVTEEDWSLAETLFSVSCAIADHAVADRRRRYASAKRLQRAESNAAAVETAEAMDKPEQTKIIAALAEAGGRVKWSGEKGLRMRLTDSKTRRAYDDALDELVSGGRVTKREDGRTVHVALSVT